MLLTQTRDAQFNVKGDHSKEEDEELILSGTCDTKAR